MRILIDARMMGPENTRGLGRYIEELIRALLDLAPEHRYVLVTRTAKHPFVEHASVETLVADIPWYGMEEQRCMPAIIASAKADVVHIPHWNVPLSYRGPLVVTIHDLLLRHVPESAKASLRGPLVSLVKRVGYRLAVSHAMKAARSILVPTQFVAEDIRHFYPSVVGKVDVTGEGMPPLHIPASNFQLPTSPPYLLYVGAAYPHKGVSDLLDAWPAIAAKHSELRLKIGGELDVFMQRLKASAEQRGLVRIEFSGRVPDAELARLYAGALAFVYPSHFEGFGLAPLEAIAAGCPVISSDAGALVEVLGKNGAIFFRAGDANAILGAVERVVNDPKTARLRTAEAARELAARHTWRHAAERTLEAYERART
jgi:glycosyltransferase involved in cell wall biosynthesis